MQIIYLPRLENRYLLNMQSKQYPFLEKAGVDEISISGMHHEAAYNAPHNVAPYWQKKNIYVDAAAQIKEVSKNVYIGAINDIHDAEYAEQILQEKKADFIWMGRALLADPELPLKVLEGREREIKHCVGCNTCIDMSWAGFRRDFRCALIQKLIVNGCSNSNNKKA